MEESFASWVPDGIRALWKKITRGDSTRMRLLRFATSGLVFLFLMICLLLYLYSIEFSLDCANDDISSLLPPNIQTSHTDANKSSFSVLMQNFCNFIFKTKTSAYDIFQGLSSRLSTILFFVLCSGCFIGFAIKQAKKSNKWYLVIYTFSLTIFLVGVATSYQAYSLTETAIEHDRMYLDGAVTPTNIEQINSKPLSNIIIEPSIDTMGDLRKLKDIINRYDKVSMFIDQTTLLIIQDDEVRNAFIRFLKTNKEKIDLYTDIEFNYSETGMLSQMALSATQSQSFIYNECYQFATAIKEKYEVDFVFGPVLDRRTSHSESTIGTRSFGQYVNLLQENAFISIIAFQHAGIQAIPKHFPGHPHVIGKDLNPHFGLYATQYADASLANNALPFLNLSINPFINSKTFMTDHISISSFKNQLPYSIYFDLENNKYGVRSVKNMFLNANEEYSFVSDDLSMLIRGYDNKRSSISTTTLINFQNINSAVALHIQEESKNFPELDNRRAIHALALLARSALISGHDMVLIRGLTVDGIEEFTSKFAAIYSDDELTSSHVLKRHLSTILGPEPSAIANRLDESERYPFSVINIINKNLHQLKFRGLLKDKFFYMFSCISRDDIAIAFGIMDEGHVLRSDLFKPSTIILKDALLTTNIPMKENQIKNALSNHRFNYYIVALSNRESLRYFDIVYKFLEQRGELDKLLVFICNTPDMLGSFYGLAFEKDHGSIYNKANFFCIYENSSRIKYYLMRAIQSNKMLLDSFQHIESTPTDIPNFYLGSYESNNLEKAVSIDALTNIVQHSFVLKNAVRIKVYINIAKIAAGCAILGFLFSLIIQWITNRKQADGRTNMD